jgi:hypothetical protein
MQSRWLNQPTLTLKIPSLIDEAVEDQEDCVENNNDTNIDLPSRELNEKEIFALRSEQSQPFYRPLKINKYFYYMILSLMIILGIVMGIYIVISNSNNQVNI